MPLHQTRVPSSEHPRLRCELLDRLNARYPRWPHFVPLLRLAGSRAERRLVLAWTDAGAEVHPVLSLLQREDNRLLVKELLAELFNTYRDAAHDEPGLVLGSDGQLRGAREHGEVRMSAASFHAPQQFRRAECVRRLGAASFALVLGAAAVRFSCFTEPALAWALADLRSVLPPLLDCLPVLLSPQVRFLFS